MVQATSTDSPGAASKRTSPRRSARQKHRTGMNKPEAVTPESSSGGGSSSKNGNGRNNSHNHRGKASEGETGLATNAAGGNQTVDDPDHKSRPPPLPIDTSAQPGAPHQNTTGQPMEDLHATDGSKQQYPMQQQPPLDGTMPPANQQYQSQQPPPLPLPTHYPYRHPPPSHRMEYSTQHFAPPPPSPRMHNQVSPSASADPTQMPPPGSQSPGQYPNQQYQQPYQPPPPQPAYADGAAYAMPMPKDQSQDPNSSAVDKDLTATPVANMEDKINYSAGGTVIPNANNPAAGGAQPPSAPPYVPLSPYTVPPAGGGYAPYGMYPPYGGYSMYPPYGYPAHPHQPYYAPHPHHAGYPPPPQHMYASPHGMHPPPPMHHQQPPPHHPTNLPQTMAPPAQTDALPQAHDDKATNESMPPTTTGYSESTVGAGSSSSGAGMEMLSPPRGQRYDAHMHSSYPPPSPMPGTPNAPSYSLAIPPPSYYPSPALSPNPTGYPMASHQPSPYSAALTTEPPTVPETETETEDGGNNKPIPIAPHTHHAQPRMEPRGQIDAESSDVAPSRVRVYVKPNRTASTEVLARRARKNSQSRARSERNRHRIHEIEAKPHSQRTEAENDAVQAYQRRRNKKNSRSKERALERKEEVDRILSLPESKRTRIEIQFLETALAAKKRKNEGDRLRRSRLKMLGLGSSSTKVSAVPKPGMTARGPLPAHFQGYPPQQLGVEDGMQPPPPAPYYAHMSPYMQPPPPPGYGAYGPPAMPTAGAQAELPPQSPGQGSGGAPMGTYGM